MLVVSRDAANSLRNQAEAIAIGIDGHVLPAAVAAAWAKERLARSAGETEASLAAVVQIGRDDPYAVAHALRKIPGPCSREIAEVLLVRLLIEMRDSNPAHANAMLSKLGASYLLHDPELQVAARAYWRGRSESEQRDSDPGPVGYDPMLVEACENFVDATLFLDDTTSGWDLPSWITP